MTKSPIVPVLKVFEHVIFCAQTDFKVAKASMIELFVLSAKEDIKSHQICYGVSLCYGVWGMHCVCTCGNAEFLSD